MICGTVGYDFSVGAFAVLMISPISFAIGNLLLRPRAGRARCSICSHGCACAAAIPLMALTLVTDGPQPTWHALSHMSLTGLICMLALWRHFHQHRLLAVGPAVTRPSGGPGGAVRTIGPVRRGGRLEHRVRRKVRAVAACRHGHRDCGIAIMLLSKRPANSSSTGDRVSAPCRIRFCSPLSCSPP